MVFLCAALLLAPIIAPAANAGGMSDIQVRMNGEFVPLHTPPILKEGRVFVPLRSVLAATGAEVRWDAAAKLVDVNHHGIHLQVSLDAKDPAVQVNGEPVKLEHPPFLHRNTTYVSVRWINEVFGAVVKWHADTRTVTVYDPEDQLPRVGSYEQLQMLVADAVSRQEARYEIAVTGVPAGAEMLTVTTEAMAMDTSNASSAESKASGSAGGSGDYSTTNVQVQGVDEADVVKTDGEYIYQVNQERILITRVMPPTEMQTVATLQLHEEGIWPRELYVDGNRLIVIGERSAYTYGNDREQPLAAEGKVRIYPIRPLITTTVALVYDIQEKQAPKLMRELEIEGNYISSRKTGGSLYVISNKYLDTYRIMEDTIQKEQAVPMVRDSLTDEVLTPVDYKDIRYFPDFIEPNYMLVASVNLNAEHTPMDVQTFLGSGQSIYASKDHLYITVSRFEPDEQKIAEGSDAQMIMPIFGRMSTVVYKFALLPGSVSYMAEGKVPGTILNQFSMDEHEGYFRIATTVDGGWTVDSTNPSQNHLYILGDALQEVGKIENIAPGERIYSVRFMGDRAYIVTFRTVDPLFVIDVADPSAPTILGELKIPGYSDYLHPYDENYLIGFGKDTVEIEHKDAKGNVIGTNAYYLGMKVALFDVTDVTNPIELHKEFIGDRGTGSELLYNHKALLFSREKNLLVFPVDLYEVKNKDNYVGSKDNLVGSIDNQVNSSDNQVNSIDKQLSAIQEATSSETPSRSGVSLAWPQFPDFGVFTYQGAYVYSLDPENGFQLRGRITHLSDEELKKAGNWYSSDKFVRRSLYIGDTLYTLSDGMIKANHLSDLNEQGSLELR